MLIYYKKKKISVENSPAVQLRLDHTKYIAHAGRQSATTFIKAVCCDVSQNYAAACLATAAMVPGRRA